MAAVKEEAVNDRKSSICFRQVTGRSEDSFSYRWNEMEGAASAEPRRPATRM